MNDASCHIWQKNKECQVQLDMNPTELILAFLDCEIRKIYRNFDWSLWYNWAALRFHATSQFTLKYLVGKSNVSHMVHIVCPSELMFNNGGTTVIGLIIGNVFLPFDIQN